MTVNLNDIKLSPNLESVHREKMSDEEYFSSKYTNYISNSRLKLINPNQNGSPSKYKEGFTGETTISLSIGSAIHELLLQKDIFTLGPDIGKPSAKLGLVIDEIFKLRKKNLPIYSAIVEACGKIHYYELSLTPSRIKSIIKDGFRYYYNLKLITDNNTIILSSKDRDTVEKCINNLNSNRQVNNLLYPTDIFGDAIETYNEEAFFIDINASYNDSQYTLKLKMKADNWTIDLENKIVTLNDLKTTGHLLYQFMEPGGSFEIFSYSRQFAYYIWVLLRYCEKEYGYNPHEWSVKCNVIVVETTTDNSVAVFPINKELLEQGRREFCKLLKMVAYCEMNGYSDDIIFV